MKTDPSLEHLYGLYRWMDSQEILINTQILGLLTAFIIVLSSIIILFKMITHSTTKWHASPIMVALVLFYSLGDLELNTLVDNLRGESPWEFLKLFCQKMIHGYSSPTLASPAGHVILGLAIWEMVVFFAFPFLLPSTHPKKRNIVDWFIFLTAMSSAIISMNTRIILPNRQKGVQTLHAPEKYGDTWIITGITGCLIVIYCLIAILVDQSLYDGCMLGRILGKMSYPLLERTSPQLSKPFESQHHDTTQQSAKSIHSSPKNTSNSTDVDAPTDDVTFLWKQMVLIRQQYQELQLLDGSSIQDIITAYSKLVHVDSLLQPLLPALDGMVALQRSNRLNPKVVRTYRLAIENAIKKVQSQTFDIVDQYNTIKFSHMMSSRKDPTETAEEIVYSAEKYMNLRLDLQQIREELAETEEDMDILDERLHIKMDEDNSNEFSGQLETQVAILVHGIKQVKNKFEKIREIQAKEGEKEKEKSVSIPQEGPSVSLALEGESILSLKDDTHGKIADDSIHSSVANEMATRSSFSDVLGLQRAAVDQNLSSGALGLQNEIPGQKLSSETLGLHVDLNGPELQTPSSESDLPPITDLSPSVEEDSQESVLSLLSHTPSFVDPATPQMTGDPVTDSMTNSITDEDGNEADVSASFEVSTATDEVKSTDSHELQSSVPELAESWAVIPKPVEPKSALQEAAAILQNSPRKLGASATDPIVIPSLSNENSLLHSVVNVPSIVISPQSPKSPKSPTGTAKKSADHMVVGLWSHVSEFEFRSDNFLRVHGAPELLKTNDLLSFVELGKYLTSKVRGNRAETAAASKVLNNLEKCAKAAKENHTNVNVGVNNLNYFRSCMWIGQARLTKFPVPQGRRVITEIPIEGIIKLSGYGPDGIKSLDMMPLPQETWTSYLHRLGSSDIKKIKELYEWLERYIGAVPELLTREVPRAAGWDTGVPLDTNRCLYRHLQNMMLLPPYPLEVENVLSIHIYRLDEKNAQNESGLEPGFVGVQLVEDVLSSPQPRYFLPPSLNFDEL